MLLLKWTRAKSGESGLMDAVIGLSGLFVGLGAVLGIFGGVVRPIHRWQWHKTIRHSVLWNGYYPKSMTQGWSSPFWLRWLHIDSEGNDRDARS